MIDTAIAFLLGDSWGRHRTQRLAALAAADGRVVSAVRAVEGAVPGLIDGWHGGEWQVSPGLLTLGGLRIPIDSVDQSRRRPTLRESLAVDEDACILRCRSGVTTIEWAVPEHLLAQATALLRGGGAA